MEQDERTARNPEQELTRRISLFEEAYEERTQRLEPPPTPPWDAPDVRPKAGVEPGRRGKHGKRSSQRWPRAVITGLIGVALGVIGTLLIAGPMFQREIESRNTHIAQLSSEIDQARIEQRAVSARRAELDQREAALNRREAVLDQRESALDRRESALDQRGQGRVRLPDIALPEGGLARGVLDRLGQRLQDLLGEAIPSGPRN